MTIANCVDGGKEKFKFEGKMGEPLSMQIKERVLQ